MRTSLGELQTGQRFILPGYPECLKMKVYPGHRARFPDGRLVSAVQLSGTTSTPGQLDWHPDKMPVETIE